MPIRVECPRCKRALAVPNKKAGSYANCPSCKGRFWVPDESGTAKADAARRPSAASESGSPLVEPAADAPSSADEDSSPTVIVVAAGDERPAAAVGGDQPSPGRFPMPPAWAATPAAGQPSPPAEVTAPLPDWSAGAPPRSIAGALNDPPSNPTSGAFGGPSASVPAPPRTIPPPAPPAAPGFRIPSGPSPPAGLPPVVGPSAGGGAAAPPLGHLPPAPPAAPVPPVNLAVAAGGLGFSPPVTAPQRKVARFITAESSASTLAPAPDGKLPELHLSEGKASETAKAKSNRMNPLVLMSLLCLSVVMSVFFALWGSSSDNPEEMPAKVRARRQIEDNFFGKKGKLPEPYQVTLREAQRAHEQGDYKTERARYRKVHDQLQQEQQTLQRGLTGSPSSDRELDALLVTLLGGG